MKEYSVHAEAFLNSIFASSGLELRASSKDSETGCLVNIVGKDSSLVLSEGGELLEALQHLLSQIYSRSLDQGERIVCDAENFRATREAELCAMARHAAERVRSGHTPFTFGPMNSNERRVIHTALATELDLKTESVGEGSARRLVVSLRPKRV
jgi:spoIIIJ-associated protein